MSPESSKQAACCYDLMFKGVGSDTLTSSKTKKPASLHAMTRHEDFRGVQLFTLITFAYSWPIFFVTDAWLAPMFFSRNDIAAGALTALFGHILAMGGPALAAALLWRWYHRTPFPRWKWGAPQNYLLAAAAMFALWTLPALVGLLFSDAFRLRWPIERFGWIVIAASFTILWLAGLGEETGWTAYLLPRLSPHIGKSRALVAAGAIRGLWHLPVLVGPMMYQAAAGKGSVAPLLFFSLLIAAQLVLSNAFFGALFGWVWYKTESLPLLGWLHQWFDAARDVTSLLVIGYGGSLWLTRLWGIPFYLAAGLALMQVAREEGANMWTLAPPKRSETD